MATIGLDYVSATYHAPTGEDIAVKIWDTAGQEKYKALTPMYYRDAVGGIIVYDITNE